jgi:pyrroloquinoline-quinone synthase
LYRRLAAGDLSRDQLQLWAKDMYTYWDNLYHSTSAVYVKTNVESVRQNMLRKLVEIEGEEIVTDVTGATTPAYEELWLRFGEGIGLSRDEITAWKPFTRTYYAITTLFMYSRWWEWTWLDGIASLYAGDLFGNEQMTRCYEALRTKYDVPDDSLEFFRVYLRHTPTHFGWEEDALSYWCCTRERQLTAARAFRERLDIEDQMLVAVNQSIATGKMPALSP